MSSPCRDFRALLVHALRGRPDPARTTELSWHEHLLACEPCRELLEAEEALELLLASLPDPRLPADLRVRVLQALATARDSDPLDGLLELDATPAPPGDLGERVLVGVAAARADGRLEALLDLVPPPGVPRGLARDVLDALEPHRRRPRQTLLRGGALAAAAVALAVLGLWWWKGDETPETPTVVGTGHEPVMPPPRVASEDSVGPLRPVVPTPAPEPGPVLVQETPDPDPPTPDPASVAPEPRELAVEPSDELLASLDVLEYWELLQDDDVDTLLGGLDSLDETLLDYGEEEG